MMNDPRYVSVALALPWTLPAVTRAEGARAAQLLIKHFGKIVDGSAHMRRPARLWWTKGRRVWISTKPTEAGNHDKGWGRLIHDISHSIHDQRSPKLRPHHSSHSRLEVEIAAYVVAKGWLDGALSPKVKATPTKDEARALKLTRVEASIVRWTAKHKRAATALKKLTRQRTALLRAAT